MYVNAILHAHACQHSLVVRERERVYKCVFGGIIAMCLAG
jgi:hypothetical protein